MRFLQGATLEEYWRLQLMQKAASWAITDANYTAHMTPLLHERWLSDTIQGVGYRL